MQSRDRYGHGTHKLSEESHPRSMTARRAKKETAGVAVISSRIDLPCPRPRVRANRDYPMAGCDGRAHHELRMRLITSYSRTSPSATRPPSPAKQLLAAKPPFCQPSRTFTGWQVRLPFRGCFSCSFHLLLRCDADVCWGNWSHAAKRSAAQVAMGECVAIIVFPKRIRPAW